MTALRRAASSRTRVAQLVAAKLAVIGPPNPLRGFRLVIENAPSLSGGLSTYNRQHASRRAGLADGPQDRQSVGGAGRRVHGAPRHRRRWSAAPATAAVAAGQGARRRTLGPAGRGGLGQRGRGRLRATATGREGGPASG